MTGNNQEIRGLLAGVLRGLGLDSRIKEQTCLLVWDEVVGEQVSSNARPDIIRDGIMFVVKKSPVWANELTFYKPDMITRLNRKVGSNVLKDIIFKSGRFPAKRTKTAIERPKAPDLEGIQLTDLELGTLEAEARSAGEDLSPVVVKLLETALKIHKWKEAHGWTPCKACGALQNEDSGVCPVCSIQK
jgi:predicted nucleic acid-binding Zn ribbon protein